MPPQPEAVRLVYVYFATESSSLQHWHAPSCCAVHATPPQFSCQAISTSASVAIAHIVTSPLVILHRFMLMAHHSRPPAVSTHHHIQSLGLGHDFFIFSGPPNVLQSTFGPIISQLMYTYSMPSPTDVISCVQLELAR